MSVEYRSAYQLQAMIAELAGVAPSTIDVEKVGNAGDFKASFVGSSAGVNQAKAKMDIDNICRQLRLTFKLQV
jgi:hypothetical protein